MKNQETYRILVVDDEAVNRMVVGAILKQEGYDVIEADSGEQCVQIALAKDPSLILLDIQMPKEDGFSTLRRLKTVGMTKNIPVMFMTAADDTDVVVQGFNLGAVDFINKRCPKEEVVARVRVHIKQYATMLALAETQIRMRNQINEAQNALLVKPEEMPECSFAVLYRSLNAAGGDMYDIVPISENLTGYFVCDFAGHGTATGFLTSQMKTLLKQNCIAAFDPIESMIIMNKVLKDTLRPGQYATANYAVLDKMRKKVSVVNMGHPPALFVPADGEARFVAPDGDILGGFDDVCFSMEEIAVEPGDRLVMYTDGLVEKSGTSIWSEEIEQLVMYGKTVRNNPLEMVPEKLYGQFFVNDRQPADDVCVLIVGLDERIASDEVSGSFIKVLDSKMNVVDPVVNEAVMYVQERLPTIDIYGLRVILYESLVNAIEHGNRKEPEKKVVILISCTDEKLVISIQDEGEGFDWRKVKERQGCEVTDTCGRGLPLMKMYGYESDYNNRGNRVTVTKRLDGLGGAAGRGEAATGSADESDGEQ